ncbi:hypothetical protein FRB96_000630 [Tulasnella sp. 330]|nr:hypothetical protein FRB96_000630 [Tulasnella sp. 330]KAG8881002.1 hypothetical protein FRB97_000247 [Tulasnella sp. 331]KAG8887431.1 hypothetical protein FRB98_009631 [Tulasnella sp. 332]
MAVLQQPRPLTIPEVFLEILSRLSAKDLMASALVCRAWLTPAIDTKWRTQAIRLSRLLSQLAPLVDETNITDSTWRIMLDFEEITRECWMCFLENYSNKVTSLETDIALHTDSLEVLKKLQEKFGGRLGSRLRTLDARRFKYRDSHFPPLFNLLLGPNQLEIMLPIFTSTETVVDLITMIKHRAPGMTKLATASIYRSIDYSGFSRLRSISHLGIFSASDYISLSNCQDLQILHIDEFMLTKWPPIQPLTALPTFPSLNELRAYLYSPELEDAIVQSITPRLRTLTFKYFNRKLDVPDLNRFLQRCILLDDLEIKVNVPRNELAKMGHENVRRLHMENWEYMSHDSRDNEFNWIGSSFPKVQELTLGCGGHLRKRSEWGILASLVPVCSHLEILTLPLHVISFALSKATSLNTPPLQSLTTLRLQTIQIRATVVDEFTRYLATLCPNVLIFEVDKCYENLVMKRPPTVRTKGQSRPRPWSDEEKELFIADFYKYQKRLKCN